VHEETLETNRWRIACQIEIIEPVDLKVTAIRLSLGFHPGLKRLNIIFQMDI
jgi:hypothetical protein